MHALFNIAGGVRYHWRGLRSANRAWSPFRDSLAAWLEDWQPGGPQLLIVGASAGYCLRMEWLGGFGEIVCLDPDPLAKILFTRRLRTVAPLTQIKWSHDNFLEEKDPLLQIQRFERFLEAHPRSPVLFSNFLGQLGLLLHESRANVPGALAAWKKSLSHKTLARRPWASFHDRVSGRLRPSFEQPYHCATRLSDDELIERLYSEPEQNAVLGDHDTAGMFPANRPHTYFKWDLTPQWAHIIEATHSGT